MEFFINIWNIYLFEPVFNILVWLYANLANHNFALAVIELTIGLRLILLPFSIISEKGKERRQRLEKEVASIEKDPHIDSIKKQEVIRNLMKKYKVSPWARMISMLVLALLFILLYQIFVGGLRSEKMTHLYTWNFHPDYVNTIFLGLDIANRYWFWALAPSVFLFLEIVYDQKKHPHLVKSSDVVYRYFFPLAVFIFLWQLPAIKSIFILTTLIFTLMMRIVKGAFLKFV